MSDQIIVNTSLVCLLKLCEYLVTEFSSKPSAIWYVSRSFLDNVGYMSHENIQDNRPFNNVNNVMKLSGTNTFFTICPSIQIPK